MAGTYVRYPAQGGSGSGVATYVNAAAFPASAADGTLAIALDTHYLYEYNSGASAWQIIASNATPISVGTFGSSPNSAGLTLASNVLNLQPADATHPGGLTSTDWNTFNNKQAGPLTGDVTTSGAAATLATVNSNIGTFVATTLNAKGLVTAGANLSGDITTSGAVSTLATVNSNIGTFVATTLNAKGLVTAGAALSGDITTSGAAATLATVNANVGAFGSATQVATFTVNAKGLTTAAGNTSIQIAESQVTNLTTDLAAKQSTTLTNTHILVGNGSNVAADVALSGDATLANTGALTLATVATAGTTGSSTSIPAVTINAKGLVTGVTGNAVIAPAGTLTGATLAAGVTASSLTSVGTIATGTWNGTTVDVAHGGSGVTSHTAYAVICGGTTTTSGVQSIASVGSSGQVLTSNGAGALPTFQAPVAGTYVGAIVHLSTNTSYTANTALKFDTVDYQNASAYATGTGLYTTPLTGTYLVTFGGRVTSSLMTPYIAKNSSAYAELIGISTTSAGCSGMVRCTAGDTLAVFVNSTNTVEGGGTPYATFASFSFIGS